MKKLMFLLIFLSFLFSAFPLDAQTDVMEEYWKNTDFTDTTLISNKAFSEQLINFLYEFTDADEKAFDSLTIHGLGFVLGKAKANMRVYEFILEYALNGYTGMGRSKVTDYLLNYPQLAEGEIAMEEGLRLDSITEPYQKVRVGAQAPDFSGVTIDNKPYCISDSKAKHIIVIFWSTDCEYCHDFMKQIRRNLNLRSDFELVTFALADSQAEVSRTIKKMRLPGYHFYDSLRWESKAFLDYHITSTPTVFVLDADKTIVCKPYDWEELREWLHENSNFME